MAERSVVPRVAVRPGQALADRYELAELLGRGGMADVYRASDRLLKREVAVKVLRQPGPSADDQRRFLTEARTLAGLSHPALVTLLDVFASDDCTFLVMEFIDGGPLSSRDERPSSVDAVAVGQQLADVLSYLHGQGVVHRDIKPGNVLIGRDGRVRLADFGIARVLGDLTSHTAIGFTMGTAAYVAPEQLLGGDISGATDIYALGLVLIEYLGGVPAFQGTAAEVASARLAAPPVIPESVPAEWRSLLANMTAVDPRERPKAADVHQRLAAITGTPSNPESDDTVVLSVTQTRPLTMPIPVATQPASQSLDKQPVDDATGAENYSREREVSHPLTHDLWRAASHYFTKGTHFSTRGQLVCLAILIAIALACIGVVAVSAGDRPAGEVPAPDVPGKIGRHLQDLHEAVYP